MSDEHPDSSDSSVDSTVAPTHAGSSVMKLVGIALGLTAIAALVVGLVFWQTLREIENRDYSVVPVNPDDIGEEESGGSPGSADAAETDAGGERNRRPEMESDDDGSETDSADSATTEPDAEQ